MFWLKGQVGSCTGGVAMCTAAALRVQDHEPDIELDKIVVLLSEAKRISKLWALPEESIIDTPISPVASPCALTSPLSVTPSIFVSCIEDSKEAIALVPVVLPGCEISISSPSSRDQQSDHGSDCAEEESSSEELPCIARLLRRRPAASGNSRQDTRIPPWRTPTPSKRKAMRRNTTAEKHGIGKQRKRCW